MLITFSETVLQKLNGGGLHQDEVQAVTLIAVNARKGFHLVGGKRRVLDALSEIGDLGRAEKAFYSDASNRSTQMHGLAEHLPPVLGSYVLAIAARLSSLPVFREALEAFSASNKALVGATAALLLAPNEGEVTRRSLKDKGTEYFEALREKVKRDGGSATS